MLGFWNELIHRGRSKPNCWCEPHVSSVDLRRDSRAWAEWMRVFGSHVICVLWTTRRRLRALNIFDPRLSIIDKLSKLDVLFDSCSWFRNTGMGLPDFTSCDRWKQLPSSTTDKPSRVSYRSGDALLVRWMFHSLQMNHTQWAALGTHVFVIHTIPKVWMIILFQEILPWLWYTNQHGPVGSRDKKQYLNVF